MGLTTLWRLFGDPQSRFEQLLRPHLQNLYRLALRYTGNRDDAEDLVQELMLKLYPRLDELQRVDHLAPWLARVLYRLFIDEYRRRQRSPLDPVDDEQQLYQTHSSNEPEPPDTADSKLTRALLESALARLGSEQRMLVLMHDVDGYSLLEISDIVDLPVGTIKSRLSRARHKLRDIINRMEPNQRHDV